MEQEQPTRHVYQQDCCHSKGRMFLPLLKFGKSIKMKYLVSGRHFPPDVFPQSQQKKLWSKLVFCKLFKKEKGQLDVTHASLTLATMKNPDPESRNFYIQQGRLYLSSTTLPTFSHSQYSGGLYFVFIQHSQKCSLQKDKENKLPLSNQPQLLGVAGPS